MHSLYKIATVVVGASQYVLSAVKLMIETVSYQWASSLPGSFAILIATTQVNQSLYIPVGTK